MAKVSELPNDELVKVYVQIRDQIAVEQKAADARKADLKAKQAKIEGILLARYKEAGIESARTKYGTAFKKKATYCSVADKDTFLACVKETQNFELIDLRANKTGVEQYVQEHEELPPGINWREEIHINVTRAA